MVKMISGTATALLVGLACSVAGATVNGNGAALYLETMDYWSGTAQSNVNGAVLASVAPFDNGTVYTNGLGAKLIVNPLNVLLDYGPPVADFSGDPRSGNIPLEVQFDDLTNTGVYGVYFWEWTFGDGDTGNGPTPTHIYNEAGTPYTVTLEVTTDGGSDTEIKFDYVVTTGGQAMPTTGALGLAFMCALIAAVGVGRFKRTRYDHSNA